MDLEGSGEVTVLAPPGHERLMWIGFPLVGAGLGWLLPVVAAWASWSATPAGTSVRRTVPR